MNDNFVDNLILPTDDGVVIQKGSSNENGGPRQSRIDCGPKLANLRRYWRDYYVEPTNRMIESSSGASSASSTASEAAGPVEAALNGEAANKVIKDKPVFALNGFHSIRIRVVLALS